MHLFHIVFCNQNVTVCAKSDPYFCIPYCPRSVCEVQTFLSTATRLFYWQHLEWFSRCKTTLTAVNSGHFVKSRTQNTQMLIQYDNQTILWSAVLCYAIPYIISLDLHLICSYLECYGNFSDEKVYSKRPKLQVMGTNNWENCGSSNQS